MAYTYDRARLRHRTFGQRVSGFFRGAFNLLGAGIIILFSGGAAILWLLAILAGLSLPIVLIWAIITLVGKL